ncbi:uncharacterized protein LOC135823418 [Sycon ciliatum]|uniref:uncharacterized protein LOC135823418 n=1 Tax=Sycon ciliatum TaxID=27933 RepID=UPI0031F655C0|eukprot:scpid83067/ scgid31117/ Beta-fructofuranosidase, insoluble isoenzyme 1; Cell wall beta-fructosidase 1; Invertase 1; OsCIN1; Sucrose hydrolase 1
MMAVLQLVAAIALLGVCGATRRSEGVGTTYPNIDYRPRYHLTCERGRLDYPSLAYSEINGRLVYHVFYHCSSLPTDDNSVDAIDSWYHTTSTNLMSWEATLLRGIPAGTTSISVAQPSFNSTKAVAALLRGDGVYLVHSVDEKMVQWVELSLKPIITPPEGASNFTDVRIWSNGTTQYYLLAGSTLNSSYTKGIHADNGSVPVTYLYESSDLKTWTSHGVFWQGDSYFGATAKSVDFYEVINAQLSFKQQVLTVTFPQEAGSFCISGLFNFTNPNAFKVYSLRHADYGRLDHTSSILDTLGRRLVIGAVDEMKSIGWQVHDTYAGIVSLPRMVLSLPDEEVGFQAPEDVSFLYGKSLGRLDGLALNSGETEILPLLYGNQMVIRATIAVTVMPSAKFSTGFNVLMSDDKSEFTTIAIKSNPNPKPVQCIDIPVSHGSDRTGFDYYIYEVAQLDECKAACCADSRCKSFVFVYKMNVNIGFNCTVGSNCCFLKSRAPPMRPSLLNISSGLPSIQNSVLSVSTLNSSLNPEAFTEEKHVPFQYAPPSLDPNVGRRSDRISEKRRSELEATFGPSVHSNEVPVTDSVTVQIFIDHSVLEVFVENALVITERIYPTKDDSMNVELFSNNSNVTFTSIEAYQMESAFNT